MSSVKYSQRNPTLAFLPFLHNFSIRPKSPLMQVCGALSVNYWCYNVFMDYLRAFREWCALKIVLWRKENTTVFNPGEIWWCSVGMNLGEEIFGKGLKFTRPVLIFRKFTSNSFLGLPLTLQPKTGTWYVEITLLDTKRWAMLNQARIFDKKRLQSRIGTLSEKELSAVRERFLEFYAS